MRSRPASAFLTALLTVAAFSQIPGIKIPGGGIPGLDSIFKKGPAITTNIKDARFEATDKDGFTPREDERNLTTLQRTPNGGFVLQPGYFKATLQSYCMHAGTHGPSAGDGYLYAPVKGPYENLVMSVARNSVQHPEIPQRDIQVLIWAMIARTKVSDLLDGMKSTASKLLTPKQLTDLNGGALGILTDDKLAGAFIKQPPLLRQVYEAEARLRGMLTAPNATFEDLERVAVLSGQAPIGEGSRDVPSGRWSQHPDGYFVRFIPVSYPTTKVEIWVPQGSSAVGKEFDPATQVATPANTARQRLLQSGRIQTSH